MSNSATPWTAARQASLSLTNSQSSTKPMSIESVMPSNHLILCRPLLLLPSIFPSIRVFSNESVLHIRWPKDWSFCFSVSPSSEHSGLVSFRMDWLYLLAVQVTLNSLLQHHSSKAWILRCSAFFIVQLSHPCMTTGNTIALTRWTFVGKVMSLLFNMLFRLVVTFLPRSKRLLYISVLLCQFIPPSPRLLNISDALSSPSSPRQLLTCSSLSLLYTYPPEIISLHYHLGDSLCLSWVGSQFLDPTSFSLIYSLMYVWHFSSSSFPRKVCIDYTYIGGIFFEASHVLKHCYSFLTLLTD